MTAYISSLIIGVSLAGSLLLWEARPQNSPEASPAPFSAPAPSNAREYAAVALLGAVGNAQPSGAIISEVVAWSIAEDGDKGAMSRNNPWNTTMCGFHMINSINADGACGVGHYATMEDGIAANAATLMQGNFERVRAALLANDVDGFRAALWASGWAASHYSGGANWPAYQMEGTQEGYAPRVSSKCLPTSTGAISAHFHDTSSAYWSAQAGGMHNGTDYAGNQGDPVYAPFGLVVEDVQFYSDPGRIGWYVQGRFSDGYLFYAGHLGTVAVRVGDRVEACQQIGTIGEVWHTHIKIASSDKPIPCEASGCDDFEEYFNEH